MISGDGLGPICVRPVRDGVLQASYATPRGPAVHVAEFLPPARRDSFRPRASVVALAGARPAHPDITQELCLLAIALPVAYYGPQYEFLPGGEGGDVDVPWTLDPRTGLSAPADALWNRDWDDQWNSAVLVTPKTAGLPGSDRDMARLAWRVLVRVDRDVLVRLVAWLLLRLEVLGPASSFGRYCVEAMLLQPASAQRMRAETGGHRPVFDPRCLRWVVQEIAVASAEWGWSDSTVLPEGDDDDAENVLQRVLFGCLAANTSPSSTEILRALWLLHEGFTVDRDEGVSGLDSLLSITGSLGYGYRPRYAWADRFNQWRRIWEIPDEHDVFVTNPGASGQPHRPSDLRQLVARRAGVDVDDLMIGGLALMSRLFLWIADNKPHFATPTTLAAAMSDRGALPTSMFTAIGRYASTTLEAFGATLLKEMAEHGTSHDTLGCVPMHDMRAFYDSPILVLSDDGAWAPLGFAALVDRIVDIPRAVVVDDGAFGDARRVGGLVGYMFEAAIADLLRGLKDRHHVLSENNLATVLGGRSYSDGVIGYEGKYVVVEASVQTLGRHIAQGSPSAVRSRCRTYHHKADQAQRTADDLHLVTQRFSQPLPRVVTILVVADVPLSFNPAVATELRTQRPGRNPRFVCSLEEFEWLLELGDVGWDIPAAVLNWQARARDVALSDRLRDLARIHGPDGPSWRFDLQAWLDSLPVEGPTAA